MRSKGKRTQQEARGKRGRRGAKLTARRRERRMGAHERAILRQIMQ